MLVACIAVARVMFRRRERIWAALVLPALLVALVAHPQPQCLGRRVRRHRDCSSSCETCSVFAWPRCCRWRSAWSSRSRPAAISDRFYSALSLKETVGDSDTSTSTLQSNRDRVAMIKSGWRIIKDNPLTGVGPDMVIQVYPGYREPTAVSQL